MIDLNVHRKFFRLTQKVAMKSLCLRDKCGAIIVSKDGIVIAEGFNEPPLGELANRKCLYDFPVLNRKKPKAGCSCCIHAEQNAILGALEKGIDLTGSIMYFVRVDNNGKQLFSGEPYCVECSKLALHKHVASWALSHEDGYKVYGAQEYNDLSFLFHLTQKE